MLTNVLISENRCGSEHGSGGGITLINSEPLLNGVKIFNNKAGGGGGIHAVGSEANLNNVII